MSLGQKLRAKLNEVAKNSNLSVNELRILLALERIVARICRDAVLSKSLIFKGDFSTLCFGQSI